MMRVIDFDAKYMAHVRAWMQKNAGRWNADEMEEHADEAYHEFVHAPADWLDGLSPEAYFDAFTDARELTDALVAYEAADVSAPDLLLARIVALGEHATDALMCLAADEQACACLRATALNLLSEIGSVAHKTLCLRLVDEGATDELVDVAADSLQAMGEAAVPDMLDRLATARDGARVIYLDLLCNFPGDERIYEYTRREFLNNPAQRALMANCLAKLGDPRAIEALARVMRQSDIGYLEYLEIANAIEALGGDAGARDRVFDGDPAYESLKYMG